MKQKAHDEPELESGADTELSCQTGARIPRAKARAILANFLPGLKARASTLKLESGAGTSGLTAGGSPALPGTIFNSILSLSARGRWRRQSC